MKQIIETDKAARAKNVDQKAAAPATPAVPAKPAAEAKPDDKTPQKQG
jgi:hypothetical protein